MYESHITLDSYGISIERFKEICRIAKVKSLWIENDSGSDYLVQPMSKCFYQDTFAGTFIKVQRTKNLFESYGLKVIRVKIEEIIRPNEARKDEQEILYREFHSKFHVPLDSKEKFLYIVGSYGAHTATNSLKSPDYFFVTTRDEKLHSDLVKELETVGFKRTNSIKEYVVYDSNPQIDTKWAKPEGCYECPLKPITLN